MKKILAIFIFIAFVLNSCNSFVKQPFNPKNYLGIVWISEKSDIQFTFDESKGLDGYGNIISKSENIPILVLFSRANYLTIVDENKYNENKKIQECEILDGTVKLKNDNLVLNIIHNKILEEPYKTITFTQQD